MRFWVDYGEKFDRIKQSHFDVRYNIWTKEKAFEKYDAIFLFEDEELDMVLDQSVNFTEIGPEGVLHIARHYHTTPQQRKRIERFFSLAPNREHREQLVWYTPADGTDPEFGSQELLQPFVPTVIKLPPDDVVIPDRPKTRGKVGRPKKSEKAMTAAERFKALGAPRNRYQQELDHFAGFSKDWVQSLAFRLTNDGIQVTRQAIEDRIKADLNRRWNNFIQMVSSDNAMYEEFRAIAVKPAVDLNAPHSPLNNHMHTDEYWQNIFESRQAYQDYLCNTVWPLIQQQLDEYSF